MSPETVGETPTHAVAQLFDAAGIKRVVCVDDVYAATIDTLLVTLAGLTSEQRAAVFGGQSDDYAEDGIWQQRARDRWETLEASEQPSVVDKAYAHAASIDPVATGASHALRAILPEVVEQRGMSLSQWQTERSVLIAELASKPTLVLFDQDFSHEQQGTEDGQRMIAELEQALATLDPKPDAYYGLLTNTVGVDEEQDRREQIIEDSGADAARLVVISKRNLDDQELGRFTARLRTTLLAPIFAGLLAEVTTEIETEQKAAIARARSIAPEDMEHMVVSASEREGEWPPDTLVRILEAMERAKVRSKLRTAPRVGELTQRLRRIAAIATPSEPAATVPSVPSPAAASISRHAAVEILREEVYDDAAHVNVLHLPVELGDLFQRPSTGKLWVVVAQPCDLMVRRKGVRAPELTHVTMAMLEASDAAGQELFGEFRLPYYFEDGAKSGVVRLARPAFVRSIILDSCVLNENGAALLDLNADIPERLLPHWQSRHVELKKVGEDLLTRSSAGKDSMTAAAITGQYKRDVFPATRADHDGACIEWDCKRVGRVGDPYARALLTRFFQYLARDAYLTDLAQG